MVKRLFVILIAATMLSISIPTSVFAEEANADGQQIMNDQEDEDNEDLIDQIVEKGLANQNQTISGTESDDTADDTADGGTDDEDNEDLIDQIVEEGLAKQAAGLEEAQTPMCEITFVDSLDNDAVFATYSVELYGSVTDLPKAPEHDGYMFSHYEGNYTDVIGNEVVTAVYHTANISAFLFAYVDGIYTEKLVICQDDDNIWKDEDGETYKDTTWYGVTDAIKYETVNGDGGITLKLPLNPALRMEYEFTEVNSRFKEDRELYYLELQDKFPLFDFRVQAGALRNSNIFDSVEVARMTSANLTLHLPYHVDVNGTFREDVRYPDIDELKLYNRARYAYPNSALKEEERVRMTGDLKWNPGGIFYGVGLRYEYVDNPIKQRWVTGEGLESIERASQWINLDYAEALDWYVAAGFSIGNWQLYLEREQSLAKQHRPIDVTDLYYKGYIRWSDKFVKNRLGVSIAFNFTWFGNRYDMQITEDDDGKECIELIELKHYLALNFEARMRILSFSLYSRIDNLNHSLYEPAAGYRPEGVRFLYGITWSFDN